MASVRKTGQHSGQRALKPGFGIADQLICISPVMVVVAIAGNDQIVSERTRVFMQMSNQRHSSPLNQAFIPAAHASPAAAG